MAFASEVAQVRLLIGDPSNGSMNPNPDERLLGNPQISDANIQNFLDLYVLFAVYTAQTRVYLAAAGVLRTFAASAAERSIQASVGGTWTHDSRKLYKNYLDMANMFVKLVGETPAIGIAEMNWGTNEEQIRLNAILRNGAGV